LIDLGLATRIDPTATDDGAGTPDYRPPDAGPGGVDPDRDLFAAGVMLAELLACAHPYGGAPRPGVLPTFPPEAERRVAPALLAVLRRAVAPSRAERFASGEELLEVLEAAGDPLAPPVVAATPRAGIAIPPDEWARPNYNPFVIRFQTLYSQNRVDNSG